MDIGRRCAWVLVGVAGLPGLLLGLITLYAVLIFPVVFGLGLGVGRSRLGLRVVLFLFIALVAAFATSFGFADDGDDTWLYLAYGTSSLLALLATFKVGMEARLRLF